MIQKAELINEFSQKAAENKAAYFIGAGISIPYGLPDFENLIRELAKGRIDLKIKPNHNFPEIAQYILNASSHDKSPILKQIQCRFNIPYNKNKSTYLDSIAKSNVSTIWTTNFDTLIEQSLKYCGKKYVSKNIDFDFKKEFETTDDCEVLKIHGDIYSNDVVIAKNDYEDFNLTHPVTIRRLEQDLLTKSLLFIGYSYKDPNIQSIINNVRQLTDGKSQTRHYMILSPEKKKNSQKLQKLWIQDLERYGIHVYLLENGFPELAEILEKICLKSKGKSVFVTGSHYDASNEMAKKLGKKLHKINDLILNYGHSDGIGKTVCSSYAQKCVKSSEQLPAHIRIFANPYSLCDKWDNQDALLGQLTAFREDLLGKTQIMIAFPGKKGTLSEVKIGLKKGVIIVPVFYEDDDFKAEILKFPEITATLEKYANFYLEKLLKNSVGVDDIILCLESILN